MVDAPVGQRHRLVDVGCCDVDRAVVGRRVGDLEPGPNADPALREDRVPTAGAAAAEAALAVDPNPSPRAQHPDPGRLEIGSLTNDHRASLDQAMLGEGHLGLLPKGHRGVVDGQVVVVVALRIAGVGTRSFLGGLVSSLALLAVGLLGRDSAWLTRAGASRTRPRVRTRRARKHAAGVEAAASRSSLRFGRGRVLGLGLSVGGRRRSHELVARDRDTRADHEATEDLECALRVHGRDRRT